MIVERLIKTVLHKWENFRSREGSVVLERVPSDLRQTLWNCKPEDLRDNLRNINDQLRSLGQQPLTPLEYKDAIDGWDVVNRPLR